MNILVVKMSSLGDVVHGLTLVTEIRKQLPDATIDWVVEEAFADVPRRHPGINKVLPVAIRRWRKNWLDAIKSGEITQFLKSLRGTDYDLVVDSQGLLKSAFVSMLAHGPRAGFDRGSARESLAALLQRGIRVPKQMHAVDRQRQLAAGLFSFQLAGEPDYGLPRPTGKTNRLMLIHGTTWPSKHWAESSWQSLAALCIESDFEVVLPAGNQEERARAERIAAATGATVLPPSTLASVMDELGQCCGAVAVDTGLAHLATALNLPLVTLYGATDPQLTGTHGPRQVNLASDHLPCIPCRKRTCRYPQSTDSSKIFPPCFEPLTPEMVWQALQQQINSSTTHPD